jgi:hypothetical protein
MPNWRTTLFGIIAFLPMFLNAITPIVPVPWDKFIMAISGAIAFYFAKDKNVTGKT